MKHILITNPDGFTGDSLVLSVNDDVAAITMQRLVAERHPESQLVISEMTPATFEDALALLAEDAELYGAQGDEDAEDDEPIDEAHGWVKLTSEQARRFVAGEDAEVALETVNSICYEYAILQDGGEAPVYWMRRIED